MFTDKLKIAATKQTPGIDFDATTGNFYIFGQSFPEDVNDVFGPVFAWMADFKADPNKEYTLRFLLTYYNTASSKRIYEFLSYFYKLQQDGHKVKVLWQYYEEDEDIYESGRYFEELIKLPFEFTSLHR